jgi:hypothetical protein
MRTVLACIGTAILCFTIVATTGFGARQSRSYVLHTNDSVRDPRSNMACTAAADGSTRCTNADLSVRWSRTQVVVFRYGSKTQVTPTVVLTPGWPIDTWTTCTNHCPIP